jgi:hypothetical protein
LLTAAAKAHHYDLVLALLDWGVDPNASVTGTTPNLPLHMALGGHSYHYSDADRRRVVELLLEVPLHFRIICFIIVIITRCILVLANNK